jgi:hypothetical protein
MNNKDDIINSLLFLVFLLVVLSVELLVVLLIMLVIELLIWPCIVGLFN